MGVLIDKRFTFDMHFRKLCKKVFRKLFTFACIARYMGPNKVRVSIRTFVISQFQYCSIVWMYHSRHLNNQINKIHVRDWRIAYNNYKYYLAECSG